MISKDIHLFSISHRESFPNIRCIDMTLRSIDHPLFNDLRVHSRKCPGRILCLSMLQAFKYKAKQRMAHETEHNIQHRIKNRIEPRP